MGTSVTGQSSVRHFGEFSLRFIAQDRVLQAYGAMVTSPGAPPPYLDNARLNTDEFRRRQEVRVTIALLPDVVILSISLYFIGA